MKNYTQFVDSLNESKGGYDYGCAMAYFNSPKIAEIQSKIDPADLEGKGIEDEHHVTLLYGLHSDEIADDDVMRVCNETPYAPIRLHNISLFQNPEFDVLKFDADCPTLVEVNRKLTKMPHTTNFPDYHPHATIAYLKPGAGEKYIKALTGESDLVEAEEIVYSKPGDKKVIEKTKTQK
jgi:2'-5' RNA ligase